MLLYISQPLWSLPKLVVLLTEFGKLSGYGVNVQKSDMMPVGTSNGTTSLNSLPFKISHKKFKYLGIWVTDKHKDHCAAISPCYQTQIKMSNDGVPCLSLWVEEVSQ